MTAPFAHVPTQAAEFSGPGRHAIVLYAPEWSEAVLEVLRMKPLAYEASWSFNEERRAHVLLIAYDGGPTLQLALVDGIHNQVLALLVRGAPLSCRPSPCTGRTRNRSWTSCSHRRRAWCCPNCRARWPSRPSLNDAPRK